ncbi:MAG: hypothetical protein JNM18_09460, partial [Planctomycetaceae bacterium]|nr:hypothetical protein [Planctomycetaceae bacterium]
LVCSSCSQASRVGSRVGKDGSKERYCKKCNATISRVAPPRKPAAAKA